jgi:hypothetical protein
LNISNKYKKKTFLPLTNPLTNAKEKEATPRVKGPPSIKAIKLPGVLNIPEPPNRTE